MRLETVPLIVATAVAAFPGAKVMKIVFAVVTRATI